MNKLKVAAQSLRDYLGHDLRGIRLLDELVEIANEQRKRIPSLEEAAKDARSVADKLRRELDASELKVASIQSELAREISRRGAAERRERVLSEVISKYEMELEPVNIDGGDRRDTWVRQVDRLIRLVRARYKRMPSESSFSGEEIGNAQSAVDADNYIKDFTDDEFSGFGMVVALLSFMGLDPVVRCQRPLKPDDDVEWNWRKVDFLAFIAWMVGPVELPQGMLATAKLVSESQKMLHGRFDDSNVLGHAPGQPSVDAGLYDANEINLPFSLVKELKKKYPFFERGSCELHNTEAAELRENAKRK